jgi:hypothetical protein
MRTVTSKSQMQIEAVFCLIIGADRDEGRARRPKLATVGVAICLSIGVEPDRWAAVSKSRMHIEILKLDIFHPVAHHSTIQSCAF